MNTKLAVKSLVVFVVLTMGVQAFAAENEKSASPVKAVKSKSKKKVVKKKSSAPEEPTLNKALEELKVEPQEKTAMPFAPSGILRADAEPVMSPVTRTAFELGLGLQPYQPAGVMKLPGYEAYRLEDVGTRPMISVEARWRPYRFDRVSGGLFAAIGYAQHPIEIRSPTGELLPNTVLQTYKSQLGLSGLWQSTPESPWAARLEVGLGELRVIQSSSSSFANRSAAESFASIGIYGERRIIERLHAFLGYDYHAPIGGGADEIDLQRSNFILGFTGGFN